MKFVNETSLYYDARSEKHQNQSLCWNNGKDVLIHSMKAYAGGVIYCNYS
jgi:hypothetical protein